VLGEIQYFTDSKYKFSPYYDFAGIPPAPFQLEWMQQVAKPEQMNKVRLCPEATDSNPQFAQAPPTGTNPGNPNQIGEAFYAWGPYGRAMRYFDDRGNTKHLQGSYAFNGYCLRAYNKTDPDTNPRPASWSGDDSVLCGSQKGANQAKDVDWLWVPPFKNTAGIPIICDGAWPTAWPKEADTVPGSLYDAAAQNGLGNNWNRVVVARHNMAINIGFFDGHVIKVDLPELWTLPWHGPSSGTKAWKPPTAANMATIKQTVTKLYKG
jgi:prepilin-type processing-associated H-X9-DG protein